MGSGAQTFKVNFVKLVGAHMRACWSLANPSSRSAFSRENLHHRKTRKSMFSGGTTTAFITMKLTKQSSPDSEMPRPQLDAMKKVARPKPWEENCHHFHFGRMPFFHPRVILHSARRARDTFSFSFIGYELRR